MYCLVEAKRRAFLSLCSRECGNRGTKFQRESGTDKYREDGDPWSVYAFRR